MSRQPQPNGHRRPVAPPDPASDLLHDLADIDPHAALHTIIEALTEVEADAVLAVLRVWITAQHPPHVACGLGIPWMLVGLVGMVA